VVDRRRWDMEGEQQREGGLGEWTKVGKGLEGIRSARSDQVHSVRLRVLVRDGAQTLAVSVFPDVVSGSVRRRRQRQR